MASQTDKRPYSKPVLRPLGLLRHITQSGSGGPNESAAEPDGMCEIKLTHKPNRNCTL
jgi:hypothetical protein